MPDAPNAIHQALGRAAGATGRNQSAQGTPGLGADIAAGLGAAAGQASANENEPIPLSSPADLSSVVGVPPRLVRALNTTPVADATTLPRYAHYTQLKGSALDFAAPGAIELRYLIRHIHDRLTAPFVDADGCAPEGSPWRGPDGGAVAGEQIGPDEHWARLATEAFSFLPYTLPVTAYSASSGLVLTDARLLYKLQGNSEDEDKAYPLAAECQHSVTLAVIGRGFSFATETAPSADGITRPRLKTMFTAGPSDGAIVHMTPKAEVKWVHYKQGSPALSTLDASFGPGSAFSFNDSFGANQLASSHPHIAFVMRVRRDAGGAVRAIQFFDVGGMNVPETPHPAIAKGIAQEGVYTYDYPWSSSGKAGALGAYSGHSVLSPSADTLAKGIARLKEARPLGLARLVLARRHNAAQNRPVDLSADPPADWLLYASPLMLMYDEHTNPYEPPPNYAISRYLWSLRDLPGAEHIQAFWQISTPRSQLADAMAFGTGKGASRAATTRSTTLVEMVTDAAARAKGGAGEPTWNIALDGTSTLPVGGAVLGIIDVTVGADGKVAIHDACRTPYKPNLPFQSLARDTATANQPGAHALGRFPWGKPTAAAGVDLATFTDVPDSFKPITPPAPPPDPDDPYGD